MKTFLISLTAFIAPMTGGQPHRAPDKAALDFYAKIGRSELLGIPDAKALESLRPMLSQNLIRLIRRAEKVEETHEAETKGEEPQLSEGWNLFCRNYEGATGCKVISSREEAGKAQVVIELRYQESADPKPNVWMLALTMVQESNRWVLDDTLPIEQGKPIAQESLTLQLTQFCENGDGTIESKTGK